MNVSIVYKTNVTEKALDELAIGLPAIISGVLEVPGGKLAILKPQQISLVFSQASSRDVGSDIKIVAFARSNDPRSLTENELARTIVEKVVASVGESYSVNVRLYLIEIGAAEHSPISGK